ncbi:hypothetical protein Tco_1326955 [Tanacetum coccineum]
MMDFRSSTMAELLRAPTEGYAEAIVVPPILAEHFELKHSLINMMTLDQFFGLEKTNPHDSHSPVVGSKKYPSFYLTWEDLVSTIHQELFPPSWTDKFSELKFSNFEQRYGERFMRRGTITKISFYASPHHGFLPNCANLIRLYNALIRPFRQDSLNMPPGGNLLERSNLKRAFDDYRKQIQGPQFTK